MLGCRPNDHEPCFRTPDERLPEVELMSLVCQVSVLPRNSVIVLLLTSLFQGHFH